MSPAAAWRYNPHSPAQSPPTANCPCIRDRSLLLRRCLTPWQDLTRQCACLLQVVVPEDKRKGDQFVFAVPTAPAAAAAAPAAAAAQPAAQMPKQEPKQEPGWAQGYPQYQQLLQQQQQRLLQHPVPGNSIYDQTLPMLQTPTLAPPNGWAQQPQPQPQPLPVPNTPAVKLQQPGAGAAAGRGGLPAQQVAGQGANVPRGGVAQAQRSFAIWSSEETALLKRLVQTEGPGNWERKAAALGTGRSAAAVSNKYHHSIEQPAFKPAKHPQQLQQPGGVADVVSLQPAAQQRQTSAAPVRQARRFCCLGEKLDRIAPALRAAGGEVRPSHLHTHTHTHTHAQHAHQQHPRSSGAECVVFSVVRRLRDENRRPLRRRWHTASSRGRHARGGRASRRSSSSTRTR